VERKIGERPAIVDEVAKATEYAMEALLYRDHVFKGLEVADEEIAAYYQSHKAEFEAPAQRRVAQILVANEGEAKAVLEKLKQGGDLGWITADKVPPGFAAILELPAGGVSPAIHDSAGWHVVRVMELKEKQQRALEEVRPQVKDCCTPCSDRRQRKVRMDSMKRALVVLAVVTLAAACGGKQEATQSASAAAAPAPVPAAQAPSVPAAAGGLTGKVVETFNGGGYTYLRIATKSGGQWAAVRETKIAKGDTVTVDAELTMEKFESKTLNRTFDRIVFGSLAGPAAAAPALSASASQHMQAPAAEGVQVEKVAGGKSVSEVWAEKSALNGKEVVVRGKVVKFLAGIMGRNWMHIQDGTGDLTVTTGEKVNVGDVVTVKGTLAADKDFGAGYRYEVILESAKVQ
jgi:hypothetical protein